MNDRADLPGMTWSRPSRCKRCGERQVRKSGHSYRCTRCRKHWHAVQYAKVSAT